MSSATLKATLQITTTASDADIAAACTAASRAVDQACGRWFYKDTDATAVRYYTAPVPYGYWPGAYSNVRELDIDDLVQLTSVQIDTTGNGTYDTTWTVDSDFYLDPPNAALIDFPYERLVLLPLSGKFFPGWPKAIKVTGQFGWPAIPPEVIEYTGILAAQLFLRSRQAPFGVIMAGMELGASARISRFDPDFDRLLSKYVKPDQILA